MTSDELNERIRSICVEAGTKNMLGEPLIFDAFGGKPVPFIGWFWRTVDFDRDYCDLGIIPDGADENSVNLTGFMESNKWDYPLVHAGGEVWQNIKQLLVVAVENPNQENFKAANDAIQVLGRNYDAAWWRAMRALEDD